MKNLVIVESPAKAKTISKFLGSDYVVMASMGHVRDLPKSKLGFDPEDNFKPKYLVSTDKKKVITDLKKHIKKDTTIYLAADEDREGEAIAWHLIPALKIENNPIKRIVFHEITKDAILKALENPREVDQHLVDAQQARRILDRAVGYELSPLLWRKVRYGLSAGRVQSVAVKIIVDRENEIKAFNPEEYWKVKSEFSNPELKSELAKINGKTSKITNEAQAKEIEASINLGNFVLNDIEEKDSKRNPAAPFTTSTIQQEASRKLGYSVKQTMVIAQQLYEGNVGNIPNHTGGLITYMRTDSLNLSKVATSAAKEVIEKEYGKEYSLSKPRAYKSKAKGAQEAHEAIRPVDLSLKPSDIRPFVENSQYKLYSLIWKRTLASQMAPAQIANTTYKIQAGKDKEFEFQTKGQRIIFAGFMKVYTEGSDNPESALDSTEKILPSIKVGTVLDLEKLDLEQLFTKPPARYTEASLVKKLEAEGIGRPSTYAPTISTIQKRGYVEKPEKDGKERAYAQFVLTDGDYVKNELNEVTGRERNKLCPTDIGIVVTDFLIEHFSQIMQYNFTAKVEQEFDEIANGTVDWTKMIGSFYTPFHERVEDTLENSERASGEREIGIDPESGRRIIARIGKFGPMAQIGNEEADGEKPKFASLRTGQSINSISLEEALELFKFPKNLGEFEGKETIVAQGRFGPYVKHNDVFISLPKGEDMGAVDLDRAIELIKAKQEEDAPVAEYEGMPVQKGSGRFGPYIKWNELFINVNRKYDFDNLTNEDIIELIETKKQKEIDKMIHNWQEEGISVQKARWGRFNIIKGKLKIELPKTFKVDKLTLEDVQKMIEEKKPTKKKKAVKKKVKVKAKK